MSQSYWTEAQQRNLDFFKRELPRLLQDEQYREKYVVVCDEQLQGNYDSFEKALQEALARFSEDKFIIQQVLDEKSTINFLYSALGA